ncbi:MAG: hypothetical protein AB2L17_02765 [Lentimicrobium sp.]|jgi:hypothetical protein
MALRRIQNQKIGAGGVGEVAELILSNNNRKTSVMVLLFCCQSEGITCQEWLTFALSVFAGLVSIGYFLRPRLYFIVYKKKNCENKNKDMKPATLPIEGEVKADANDWKYCIKVENMNIFRNTIKEVKCEIAVSEDIEFTEMKTIMPKKPDILFLKSARKCGENKLFNYVFWFNEKVIKADHKYLRVRLLASNALGVKKHYERYFKLEEIRAETHPQTQSQCWHRINTDNEFTFIKPGLRCCLGAKFEKLFDCKHNNVDEQNNPQP